MKNVRTLIIALSIVCMATSCKKNDPDNSAQEPTCPVSNSIPDKVDRLSTSGVTRTTQYTYDAQNRVTQITGFGSSDTQNITYLGLDTVMYSSVDPYNGLNIFGQIAFNSLGDHLTTKAYFIRPNGDTLSADNTEFSYDALHQLKQYLTYNTDFSISSHTQTLADSASFEWAAGNLVRRTVPVTQFNVTYEYLPNSNGYFIYNTPDYNAIYILNTISKGKISANLVSKATDGNGVVTAYTYTFDASGRVKTVNFGGNTYTFHWKCI